MATGLSANRRSASQSWTTLTIGSSAASGTSRTNGSGSRRQRRDRWRWDCACTPVQPAKHTLDPATRTTLSHRTAHPAARALARDSKWFNQHGGWDLDWARHQENCPTDGCQTCKEPSDFSSWIHDKNVKLILLERSASLPHFISEMKQHALDTNRCTDSECADRVAKQKIRVDLAQMHRWFNYTTDYWDMMKDFARRSSLERQFFTYDEMCDRPQARGATSNLRRAT